jgi:hypothetical protein
MPHPRPKTRSSYLSLSILPLGHKAQSVLYRNRENARKIRQVPLPHLIINLTRPGPIVRVTPDEISLSDPANYDQIYFIGSKYPKSKFYNCFGAGYSTFSSLSHSLHRVRRNKLNPFFSRKMVLELESVVQSKAAKLCSVAEEKFGKGESLDAMHAFRAVSIDVITDYAFGDCYDLLGREDGGKSFFEMIQKRGAAIWWFVQWPAIRDFVMGLPRWVVGLSPPIAWTFKLVEVCAFFALLCFPLNRRGVADCSGIALSKSMPISKRRYGRRQTLILLSTNYLP